MRVWAVFRVVRGGSGHKSGPDACMEVGVGAVELKSGTHTTVGSRRGECASLVPDLSTDNCLEDMAKMVQYLLGKGSWGSQWQGLVAACLAIEHHNNFNPKGHLLKPTKHRPSELPKWFKYAR